MTDSINFHQMVLFLLGIVAIMAGLVILYFLATFVLNIINTYKERNRLRDENELLKSDRLMRSNQYGEISDAYSYLKKKIDFLQIALDTEREDRAKDREEFEAKLELKNKKIDGLNKRLLINADQYQKKTAKKKAPTVAAAEANDNDDF